MANQLKPAILLLVSLIVIGAHAGSSIKRPTTAECDKQNTYFRIKHIYTYVYTMTTSGSFAGTSGQRSGSKLTCKVTLEVPRKCEIIMKLTSCNVQGLDSDSHVYTDADDDDFVQQLESHPLYFQMNKGYIVKDTIVAFATETETILNIKRGVISALQFDIKFPKKFEEKESTKEVQKEITDIFGTCPTQYIYNKDAKNDINTLRSLPDCQLLHISITQYPMFGSTTLRSITGGVKQEPLKERSYMFDTSVYCKYSSKNRKSLEMSTCTQQHIFKPATFVDDRQTMHSLIVNVTQTLELEDDKFHKKQRDPNRKLNGRKVIDIGFDFGQESDDTLISELENAMEDLKLKYQQNDVENIPEAFEDVVFLMRKSRLSVLHDFMKEVFSCGQECDHVDTAIRTFFLDGLKSCGTSNCYLQLFECIQHEGHVDMFASSEFLYGLGEVSHVEEKVQRKMLEYCKKSGSMRCWLPFGSVLSKMHVTDKKLSSDSPMGLTWAYIKDELTKHCGADKLEVSPRHLITVLKVLGNIGLNKMRISLDEVVDFHSTIHKCYKNKVIPDSVVYVILQEVLDDHRIHGYKDMHEDVVEDLLGIFDDDTRHNNIRTLVFSILSKTSDEAVLKRLSERYLQSDTYNEQLMLYMTNSIHLMYENDQPDLQHVREAWKKQPRPHHIYDRHRPFLSKPIYFGDFFKVPLSEYFGGVLYMDLIYDPSSSHVSSITLQLNYYYENTRYNMFEFTWNVHGIDQLYAALNMKPEDVSAQFMAILKGGMGNGPDGENNFPKFQQDLVMKVMKLLDKVNYPKFPDFDIYVDLKRYGQSFAFMSLQEILGMVRGMAQHNQNFQRDFLQRLLQSIDKDSFKATEFASINWVIPTGAGIPMKMTGRLAGWNRVKSNIKSNLLLLMAKKATDVTMGLKQFVLFNLEYSGSTQLPIGNVLTSGVGVHFKLGSERDLQVDVQYGKTEDGSRKFLMTYAPISKEQTSETWIYARGRQFVMNDDVVEEVREDVTVQSTYKRCLGDMFQAAIGRSLCVTFNYPKVGKSTQHPYFPISGPFDMEVVLEKVDSVDLFSVDVDYTNNKDLFRFLLQHSGPGTTLNRITTLDVNFDKKNRRMEVHAAFADFGIEYRWVFDLHRHDIEVSEFLWMQGKEIMGYRIKGTENKEEESWTTNLKLARYHIFWELDITMPRRYRSPKDHLTVVFTYYCSQLRSFLYLLHLSPEHAMINDDKTVVTVTFYQDRTVVDKDNYHISLELLDDKLEMTYIKEQDTYQFMPKYTTKADGTTRELSGTFTLVKSDNIIGGPEFHGTVVVDGTEFGLASTGTIDADMQSFQYTSEITYDKDLAANSLSRKKRSIRKLYEKFEAMEEAVIDKFHQMEESFIGKRSVDSQIDTSSEKYLSSVIPIFPSIWELPNWTSNLEIKGTLSQVPATENSPPTMQFVTEFSFLHPWNGGYRHVEHTQEFGMGGRNSFRNFKYWTTGELNMTYTNFDGTPTLNDDGEPLKVVRFGEMHVNRQSGKFFDFGVHHNGPHLQMKYEVMFDWDAASHDEPLVRVVSDYQNSVLPYFNHQYEEKFSIADGHWVHFFEFNHKMISHQVKSDLLFNSDRFYKATEITIEQSGTLGFPSSDQDKTFTFSARSSNLKGKGPLDVQYSVDIQDSTFPDKVNVYTYYIKEGHCGVLIGEKTSLNADEVTPLWGYRYDLLETRVKVTISWEPHTDESVQEMFKYLSIYPGMLLKTYGEKIKNDFRLPFMRQPIFFTSVSLDDLIRSYVKPNVMNGFVFYNNVMANFVPKEKRQGRDGNINPRLYRLLQAMKNFKDGEPNNMRLMLQRLNFLTVNGLSNVLLMQGAQIQHSLRLQDVFDKREAVYSCTFSFILEYRRNFYFIEWRESDEHLWRGLRSLRRSAPLKAHSSYAVIFKQRERETGLNILTFAGHRHEIPVNEAVQGTYLLAADVAKRRYSLVSTPSGITLIGTQGSVTIGFDNDIFTNDHLIPSTEMKQEIGDKEIIWTRNDAEIIVETAFGLSVTCDMTWSKVCFIGLDKLYRNGTIGLLGTNNHDAVVDRRDLEGHYIKDTNLLMSDFCLDGCADAPDIPGPSKDCQAKGMPRCHSNFRHYQYRYYSCRHALGASSQHLKDLQCNSNTGCAMDPYSICVMARTLVTVCEREHLLNRYEKRVNCAEVPNKFLELVFVIPVNGFGSRNELKPLDHMLAMVDKKLSVWSRYYNTRIGVVGFNGDRDKRDPFIIRGQENANGRYFFEMDEFTSSEFIDLTRMAAVEKMDKSPNSFKGIKLASSYPFNIPTDKIIIIVTTMAQSNAAYDDLDLLKGKLTENGITLVALYKDLDLGDPKVIGLNHDGKVITNDGEKLAPMALPKNTLTELIRTTKGSMWSLDAISWDSDTKIVVEHLINSKQNKRSK